jgi:hypothetical protein
MIWVVVVLSVLCAFLFLACLGLQVQLQAARAGEAGWRKVAGEWKQTADAWRDTADTARTAATAIASLAKASFGPPEMRH